MLRSNQLIKVLLCCVCWYFVSSGITNPVNAAQQSNIATLADSPLSQSETLVDKLTGKVTEVITTDSFTYIEVEIEQAKVWAAGPLTKINQGETITFSTAMPMRNFYSQVLQRDFDLIYFTPIYLTDQATSIVGVSPQLVTNLAEVKIGGYLRQVTMDSLTGRNKTFSDFKGKPLIINVWASWCGPCLREMGSLERLSHWNNGKDFNIIGISTDDYRDKATAFIKQTEITFENFIDHKLVLEKMLGANTIPLTLLVDADGRILEKVRGAIEWDSSAAINSIGKVFNLETEISAE